MLTLHFTNQLSHLVGENNFLNFAVCISTYWPPQECGILYVATVKTVVNKINVSAKLYLVLLIFICSNGFLVF